MEDKLSNAESESQVLRQQALDMTQKLSSAESEIQEMTEKLKKAESELQGLRQQALTMTPIPKSAPARSKTMVVQVCLVELFILRHLCFLLYVAFVLMSYLLCTLPARFFFVKSQRNPENGHVQNGEAKPLPSPVI